jgi:predicted XRE-type DNA-binding protein
MTDKETVTPSSGNIFEDLGLPNAKTLKYKADLTVQISKIIKQKKWTQLEAAKTLGIAQAKLSAILSGRITVTLDKLITYLEVLGYEVEITSRKRLTKNRKRQTTTKKTTTKVPRKVAVS